MESLALLGGVVMTTPPEEEEAAQPATEGTGVLVAGVAQLSCGPASAP